MIALMKIGAAYVPIAPGSPLTRVQQVYEQSGSTLVLTDDSRLIESCPRAASLMQLIEADVVRTSQSLRAWQANDIAYVIFTSGSTGRPKGVPITHQNLAALLKAVFSQLTLGNDDRVPLLHSTSFDFSVWEIWSVLAVGGALIIPNRHELHGQAFTRMLVDQGVTVLNQTPAEFAMNQASMTAEIDKLSALRTIIFGGDKLHSRILVDWVSRCPLERCRIVNMYGITETTVHASYHEVIADDLDRSSIPIGQFLPGFEFRIRSGHGQADKTLLRGPLELAGCQVTSGYLNDKQKTEAAFYHSGHKRYYRTGDIVELTEDGALIVVGRSDNQISLNGFRIEPEEIESVLTQATSSSELLVYKATIRNTDILVCLVSTDEQLDSKSVIATLSDHANKHLPAFMRPMKYLSVSALDKNENAKIDRKKNQAFIEELQAGGMS
ncbi:hypothetical protein SAJA_12575 [Salinisphaera japonica YTM-1]|uniref:Peptide synthetase n=2 Tax=Salinisphaera TaxID=180541 RepID=A0A423PJ80_9GAMM|nr:hypothetical protein SAJA_12575 [Salinisphaera japonica YTM-1]